AEPRACASTSRRRAPCACVRGSRERRRPPPRELHRVRQAHAVLHHHHRASTYGRWLGKPTPRARVRRMRREDGERLDVVGGDGAGLSRSAAPESKLATQGGRKMFPQILTSSNALATFVLFLLAGAGWSIGARIVAWPWRSPNP